MHVFAMHLESPARRATCCYSRGTLENVRSRKTQAAQDAQHIIRLHWTRRDSATGDEQSRNVWLRPEAACLVTREVQLPASRAEGEHLPAPFIAALPAKDDVVHGCRRADMQS